MAWISAPHLSTGHFVEAADWDLHADNLNYIVNNVGNLSLSGTGPHGLGSLPQPYAQFTVSGTYNAASSGNTSVGLHVVPTIYVAAGQIGATSYHGGTLIEASTGTHALFATMYVNAPTITAGAASLTHATSVMIAGAPTGGTNNYCLYIEGGGHDGIVMALSDSDVVHGITDLAPTTVYGVFRKANATEGGLSIQGYSEGALATKIHGVSTSASTTESGSSNGNISLIAEFKSGTGTTTHAADDNIVIFKNNVNATHIFKGDGSSWEDVGTAWSVYDDHDDLALIESLEYEITSEQGNPIQRYFSEWMTDNRERLQRLRLATFNADGTIFMNRSGVQALMCGFARQAGRRIMDLESRLTVVEGRLA